MSKVRAKRNRTIVLSEADENQYGRGLTRLTGPCEIDALTNGIVNQDILEVIPLLPDNFADLLILDPPYNLTKTFASTAFRKKSTTEYAAWLENLLIELLPKLKKAASVYVCSEWYSSTAVHLVLDKLLKVRNRITWERDKGRGARANWKNASEDIWFATVSDDYVFNVDAVKLKRQVLAPYTDVRGSPKDWDETSAGQFRLTHPSNLWNDITVPFWSMPENTDHPTQKPEKLLAKLILASTNEGDFVLDPFMGVGSSIVTAGKLNRRFLGVEIERQYCLLAAKRLHMAKLDRTIQGYTDGVFWERNTLGTQRKRAREKIQGFRPTTARPAKPTD
ncbi:MAG: DNA-methyltransferase [Planctomycetota bacterium]